MPASPGCRARQRKPRPSPAQAIEFAAGDSAFALCQTLVLAAIPIAIWRGDDAAAEAMTDDLDAQAGRYSLGYWRSWVPAFRALLQHARRDRSPIRRS